jgi:uncharacterized membrane protein YjjP (DUF1212 family)
MPTPALPALGERFAPPPPPLLPDDDPAEVVMQLGRALHAAGSSANRIEEGMELVSQRLDLHGQFFSTPTALFASFGGGDGRRTILERVQPGEVNLERMSRLAVLLGEVAAGGLSPRALAAELAALQSAPARYGPLLTTLAFALTSGAAAQFLGGGWREVAGAALLGLLVGGLASLAPRAPAVARLFEPLAALLASFAATVAAVAWPPLSVLLVMLAGIIVLVPGLTLTIAISELANRQLVSGSARLAGAVALFFGIALGVAVGGRLGAALAGVPPDVVPTPLADGWRWVALLAAAAALTVLLRARPRDAGWLLVAGVLAIEGVRVGGLLLGGQLGAFVGALLVGLGGNLYSRLRAQPAAVLQVPGLILLVPGSLGFRSLAALLEQDVLAGVQTAFSTSLVAIALATGILLANVVLPPRRVL